MPNVNEVNFPGHLGRDVELKKSATGKSWCRVSLGITLGKDQFKKTVWPRITLFGKNAEYVSQFKKGDILEFKKLTYATDEVEKDGVKITYHGFVLPPWGVVEGTKKGTWVPPAPGGAERPPSVSRGTSVPAPDATPVPDDDNLPF